MRLSTLKRLCSDQQTRPAPSSVGLSEDGAGSTPVGPCGATEYLMPTMAILNSAIALAVRLGGTAATSAIAGALESNNIYETYRRAI